MQSTVSGTTVQSTVSGTTVQSTASETTTTMSEAETPAGKASTLAEARVLLDEIIEAVKPLEPPRSRIDSLSVKISDLMHTYMLVLETCAQLIRNDDLMGLTEAELSLFCCGLSCVASRSGDLKRFTNGDRRGQKFRWLMSAGPICTGLEQDVEILRKNAMMMEFHLSRSKLEARARVLADGKQAE
jgi:hypothetical protein